jgi:hypothetical protein
LEQVSGEVEEKSTTIYSRLLYLILVQKLVLSFFFARDLPSVGRLWGRVPSFTPADLHHGVKKVDRPAHCDQISLTVQFPVG